MWLLTAALLILSACASQETPAEPTATEPPLEPTTSNSPEATLDENTTVSPPTTEPSTAADSSEPAPTIDPSKYDEYEIVTLLPPDAIPAIDDPQFLTAAEASEEYEPDELILGVFINGDARAYSVPHLSSHEIVNDTVGGRKISVTW